MSDSGATGAMDAWYWLGAERLERVEPQVPRSDDSREYAIAPVLRWRAVGPVHAIDRETGQSLCDDPQALHVVPRPWGEIGWDETNLTPCSACRERYAAAGSAAGG